MTDQITPKEAQAVKRAITERYGFDELEDEDLESAYAKLGKIQKTGDA